MTAVRHIKEFAEDNVFIEGRYNLLKSAVLYGANASGKSNILAAISFFRWFLINSAKETQLGDIISVTPFKLHVGYEKCPSSFEVSMLIGKVKYRYGCELNKRRVCAEWLLRSIKTKEQVLFIRDQEGIEVHKEFEEGEHLEEKTRDNALFLSVVSQFNGKIAGDILQWFRNLTVVSGLDDRSYEGFTAGFLSDDISRIYISDILKSADLGIAVVEADEKVAEESTFYLTSREAKDPKFNELENQPEKRYKLISLHNKTDAAGEFKSLEAFDFDQEESEGTKKFFRIIGPILEILSRGGLLIIDELDARLHPLLTQQIVQLFNSKDTNSNNAQLIFATHDTNLLSACTFRRDQIWFVEKDRIGGSDLYSLAEYKLPKGKVRKDASFEKDYIKGRYGAIPFLGDFKAFSALTHGPEKED